MWLRGNDYHEVLRSRVRSQAAVNGFAGVSQAEAHAAASSFAAWDLDRDGVLSRTEFETVVQSLADGPPLDDETAASSHRRPREWTAPLIVATAAAVID